MAIALTQAEFVTVIMDILGRQGPYKGTRVTPDSPIEGRLDSLALVGFLVDIESYLESELALQINLTDELLELKDLPLKTVKQFAGYLEARVKRP